MFMSLQIINSDFGLHRYFKVSSSLLRYSLTSPVGALYRLNIINVPYNESIFKIKKRIIRVFTSSGRLVLCCGLFKKLQIIFSPSIFSLYCFLLSKKGITSFLILILMILIHVIITIYIYLLQLY
jgi:hypothetical protein